MGHPASPQRPGVALGSLGKDGLGCQPGGDRGGGRTGPTAAARARRVPAGCPLGALGPGAGPSARLAASGWGGGAAPPTWARGWGLGSSCRQSRPPACGVMATTLPTWTQRKGEERRYHDSREDGRRLPAWALTRRAGGRSRCGAQSWGLGAADGLGLWRGGSVPWGSRAVVVQVSPLLPCKSSPPCKSGRRLGLRG